MTRKRAKKTLKNSPLVLVLCQVRFSPLMAMGDYIAKIQDKLRLSGYPINNTMQIQEFMLGAAGGKLLNRPQWEVLTKDRTTSVIVNEGFLVLQTTAYDDFEAFLSAVADATEIVSSVVGGLLVQRVGLRYVDLIRPKAGESWQQYVQPGLCGFASDTFAEDEPLRLHQTVARTEAGTMIIRLLQNRDGTILPPDLTTQSLAPPLASPPDRGDLLTLVDIDHFHQCDPEELDRERLEEVAWSLKNGSYDVFVDDVVTSHAMAVWQ